MISHLHVVWKYVFLFILDGDGSDEYTRTKYFIRSLFMVSKLDQIRRDYLFLLFIYSSIDAAR